MFQNLNRMLVAGGTLKIRCDACGHQVTWPKSFAVERLGGDATPYELRRRLACSACGKKGFVSVWI
jgi:DNA-directed RNA polymerase subunit RPC12/RpoP